MNILILGPQGSGKGTQAQLLVKKFQFTYFASGDFLRDLAKTNTQVLETINKGELLPDEEMFGFMRDFFEKKGTFDNIVFDGYPRSVKQHEMLRDWLGTKNTKVDVAFLLQISDEETIRRLSARRMDPETGTIYNLITNPPPQRVDKEKLVTRDDDLPEAIKERLELYHKVTAPLIGVLKNDGILVEIDGERSIDVIQKDLVSFIEKKK